LRSGIEGFAKLNNITEHKKKFKGKNENRRWIQPSGKDFFLCLMVIGAARS
jgi:hypothetical protein